MKLCTHPRSECSIHYVEMIPTERGGLQAVPSVWRCSCGYIGHRVESCPTHKVRMKVEGYIDELSSRFRCPEGEEFYFRDELNKVKKSSLYESILTWFRSRRKR